MYINDECMYMYTYIYVHLCMNEIEYGHLVLEEKKQL